MYVKARTPIVCIAASTGIAPFRAFAQERAAMIAAGRKDLAPALLFFGCRNPEVDDLYRDELDVLRSVALTDQWLFRSIGGWDVDVFLSIAFAG
ncbi:hypothetical protein MRS44_013401 [Fusarium solani]|uniref:uncharacterized protein n=1 Tax=Fusarium solani TaxID=169388 RepID=UPI0032C3E5F9|nr:hypothetical protein MRS44_013401 [Fusarium solani]